MMLQKKFNNTVLRFLVLLSAILALSGCGTFKKTLNFDSVIKAHFTVTDEINPDRYGNASPLILRIYDLKDRKQFDSESFLSLYEADKERLGPDFIRRRNLQEFTPGENRYEELLLDHETRYVGIIGEFVQYKNVRFRLVIPVEPHSTKKVHVILNSQGISLH